LAGHEAPALEQAFSNPPSLPNTRPPASSPARRARFGLDICRDEEIDSDALPLFQRTQHSAAGPRPRGTLSE
jgi:hypothetical protein